MPDPEDRYEHISYDLGFVMLPDGTVLTSDGQPRGSWPEGTVFRKPTEAEQKMFQEATEPPGLMRTLMAFKSRET